mgnify:CR=1 FL=1
MTGDQARAKLRATLDGGGVIIGAGARGNKVFADLIDRHDTGFRNAGVVESPLQLAEGEEFSVEAVLV